MNEQALAVAKTAASEPCHEQAEQHAAWPVVGLDGGTATPSLEMPDNQRAHSIREQIVEKR